MGEIFERTLPAIPFAWTGERMTTASGPQVEVEHLHRYLLARTICRGLDVLDVASGEGYGSALLAQTARSVVGIEIDPATIKHAQNSYTAPNLRFLEGDARSLPLPDECVDVVVSFETIEHFYEHDVFIAEVRRVLRPGGRFVVSSPERDIYSPAGSPPNPYHVRELTRAEFSALLNATFQHVILLGQRPVLGSVLIGEPSLPGSTSNSTLTFERHDPKSFEASEGLPRAVYLLAVASDTPIETLPNSIYIHNKTVEVVAGSRKEYATAVSKIEEFSAYARGLENELVQKRHELEEKKRELEENESARKNELAQKQRELEENELARKNELAQNKRELEVKSAILDSVLHSSSWRLTQPLRSLIEHRPQARRTLRRTAKLIWWTITLQLPARIVKRFRPPSPPLSPARPPSPPLSPARPAVIDNPASLYVPEPVERQESPASSGLRSDIVAPFNSQAPTEYDPKVTFKQLAQAELLEFLASGERLSFSVAKAPDISVVVVLWNQAHLTLRCLRALVAQIAPSIEIVLVDNASSDETNSLLSCLDGVRILRSDTNEGFLLGCNRGASASHGRALLLLNSDAVVQPGALAAALATLDSNSDVGAVGGRLVLPSGRLQEAGSIIWSDASTSGYGRDLPEQAGAVMFRRDVDYCSGAFLLTPRDVWNRLGGFDVAYAPAYYEDVDYCMRLREAGYRVVYEPAAVVDHYQFGSEAMRGDAIGATLHNRKRFRARHAVQLRHHLPASKANVLAARERLAPGRRRLLVIDREVPLRSLGSGYPRARAMLVEAAAAGWSVTLFPLHQLEVDWDIIRKEIPWEIEVASDWGFSRLAEFLDERCGHYDVAIVSRPDNMATVRSVIRDRPHLIHGTRLIYDAEALFSARDALKASVEGKPYDAADIEARTAAEVGLADDADAISCVTKLEASVFRAKQHIPVHILSHAAEPIMGTPNFADRSGFLFVGRLLEHETPNWQGLAWFIRECWPLVRASLPDATLSVAGHLHSEHAALKGPDILLFGPVADLTPLYASARVFVAPIRFAAGVPIKILEATAAGLPTVGTRLMARQLTWNPGVEIVAEDNVGALATAAVGLHEDEAAWNAIRTASQKRLYEEHSAALFRERLRLLLDGCSPPTTGPDAVTDVERSTSLFARSP